MHEHLKRWIKIGLGKGVRFTNPITGESDERFTRAQAEEFRAVRDFVFFRDIGAGHTAYAMSVMTGLEASGLVNFVSWL